MKLSPLFTDLYQLTMMCAYLDNNKREWAAFELFVRELPEKRNYLVYAGLQEIVDLIESLRFSKEDIDYLYSLKLFPDWFLDFLKEYRFSGLLYSMKEGTLFFQHEPVLRVEAPIYEAQLLETAIMNQIHASSLIATKAARVFSVSKGKLLADFSLRRTHGIDAGLKVARNSYIAGFNSTSNVLAGKIYKIPVVGTVAHSFITCFDSEEEAFRAYAKTFPHNTVLLVDTYDTIEGVKKAIKVAKELESKGYKLKGIRLDSGDIVELSRISRRLLDEAGLNHVKIIVSGGLDEYKIDEILKEGAIVDGFGVGTRVGTSADVPYIDFVYKLVEFDKKPVMKTSKGKKMYPGRKQVFRQKNGDVVGSFDEKLPGEPLLEKIIENGNLVKELPSLNEIRDYFIYQFNKFPERIKNIHRKEEYPVTISQKLENLYETLMKKLLSGG
ncbi:nicotinate phosphoribosyltransferase [Desulfurobacterium thermolithotrophum DSM 11699]|uniref:Nicotinate phosphoribosyltransferase n=1 Tax=Desulfurobacterium thermolithotrophum (strain DSM 11699 / BSA) TaxID=868864 RepID=F0S2J1_DESTD|nr:nicotinate phosphoribosyltransferase [Desulfurobacterium thermolithotrophum]ADY73063.1 nicotinate phosphoribosyltransferase [Desulfurobacterium thermolithotrophum DSM 11699]